MSFPSHADYDLAVRYIGRFVFDPLLKVGVPRSRSGVAVGQGGEPLCFPGGFAKVYVVDCASKTYALRVWLHEISNAAKRYHAIAQFLKRHPLPFFVEDFEFVAGGILAQGKRYPILRMEWVNGHSLCDFIKMSLKQPSVLCSAAETFAAMVAELHAKGVAHGDLQSENLLLYSKNGTVRYKLIDYDTLVVPALLGEPTASTGLASYQHPNRAASLTATEKDDYFSELVIYATMLALAREPNLWEEFPANGRDKELLFEAEDFAADVPSPLFQRLYKIGGTIRLLVIVLWNFSRCPNIQLLLPLENVIELTKGCTATNPSQGSSISFEKLLKKRLGERQVRKDQPDSWLDDSAFQVVQRQRANSREVQGRPPHLPTKPQASPRIGTTPGETFQDILARVQAHPTVPTPVPSKSLSGCAIACVVILGIFAVLIIIGNLQNTSTSPRIEENDRRTSSTPVAPAGVHQSAPPLPAPTRSIPGNAPADAFVQSDESLSLETLYQNAAARNHWDVTEYMETIHPENPKYDDLRTSMTKFLGERKFSYSLDDLRIISQSSGEIRISCKGTYVPLTLDGRQISRHMLYTMRRSGGVWKIYDSEVAQ